MTEQQFQGDLVKTLADFSECIERRGKFREQLERTASLIEATPPETAVFDLSAVQYLHTTAVELVDLAIEMNSNMVADLQQQCDQLARLIGRN